MNSKISEIWWLVGIKRWAKYIPQSSGDALPIFPFPSHNASYLWYFATSDKPFSTTQHSQIKHAQNIPVMQKTNKQKIPKTKNKNTPDRPT